MELFKVTCVTCQAKLSVRDAALIGEIVACPRCESMVLVEAPAALSPTPPPVTQVESLVEQPASPPLEDIQVDSPAAEAPASAEAPDVTVPMAAAGSKAMLWWIASFVIGASVTTAFLVLRQQAEPKPNVVAGTVNIDSAENPQSPEVKESTASIKPIEQSASEDNPNSRSPGMTSRDKPSSDIEVPPQSSRLPASTEPSPELAANESTIPTESLTKDSPSPKLVVESPEEPRIARKFDPLRYDLEQMDLTNLGTTDEAEQSTASLPTESPAEEVEAWGEANLVEKPAVVRLSDDNSTQIATRTAETQLEHVVPSLTLKDMSITDFLDLIGSLAGVPISVSPIELQMAGISPSKRVSLDAQEIRLDEALAKVLGPLHLDATTDGPQVVIVREAASRIRKIDYPIDDLLGTQTTAEDMAEWIEKLVAPETWANAGGIGKITTSSAGLSIEQAQGVHYHILFFLERIRLTKQMPLRSRFPARLLVAKPLGLAIADRVSAPTTFTFTHDTPLAEVFRYWQSEMGLAVLVDWPALAKANLWPDSRISCSITNEPWHVALEAVLTPLELGWRASPGGTIQITTQASLENAPLLDIYPADLWQDEPNSEAIAFHDPGNKLVYVRASAAKHRKLLGR